MHIANAATPPRCAIASHDSVRCRPAAAASASDRGTHVQLAGTVLNLRESAEMACAVVAHAREGHRGLACWSLLDAGGGELARATWVLFGPGADHGAVLLGEVDIEGVDVCARAAQHEQGRGWPGACRAVASDGVAACCARFDPAEAPRQLGQAVAGGNHSEAGAEADTRANATAEGLEEGEQSVVELHEGEIALASGLTGTLCVVAAVFRKVNTYAKKHAMLQQRSMVPATACKTIPSKHVTRVLEL